MSQKKAHRNRVRELTRDLHSAIMSGDGWKTVLAHLVWCLPPNEMRAHLAGSGSMIMVTLVDACDPDEVPRLKLELPTVDAIMLISDELDADMIQTVTDDYFELVDPFFPGGVIATLSVTRSDEPELHTIVTIRPEDYDLS